MGTAPLRQRVVDDTDPTVQYGTNGWFIADPSTLNDLGNFGPIYQGTSHATTSTNSTLSFPFNGTAIRVYGTISVSTVNNVTDPTWDCFVDEIAISNPQPAFKFPENNWVLCEQPAIASGSHVLTIQVQSKGQAFYFDYVVYTPPPDETFETAVLIYPNTDPSVSFSNSGWGTFGGENGTNVKGSQVALNFLGTSASMYGFVPTELPHNSSWAIYTLDNGSPVNFTLAGLSSPNSATSYNVKLFNTSTIPNGEHNLVVTYGGDSQHTPLVLSGFYVTNTTSSSPSLFSPSPSPSLSPSATTSSLPTPIPKRTSVGAIAGGVIGGVVALALLAVLALFYRRQRRATAPTTTTPYTMSMADAEAPPLVPGPYPLCGGRSDASASRPSTNYPYMQPTAPLHQHPSDSMSSSRGTHTVSSSEPSRSTGGVASHGHPGDHASTPSPVSSKLARERGAQNPRPAVVVRHEDSGVRLRPLPVEEEPEVVELPPGYSPE
ncbi:hypothetical protein DFH06DRAFT_1045289 [Mycena polygramma]|nr:hypothetical protein DFH06DRAFT_1045289 [Mycena polygramma]